MTDHDTPCSWGTLLDLGRQAADGPAVDAVVDAARRAAELGPVRRVYRYEDIGKHRSAEPFPEMCKVLEDEIRQTFALGMSDHLACSLLAQELPLLAAGCRLGGDDSLRQRVLAQLDEMASWSPIQRPGWTLFRPGSRLPPDGKDGNWLATGTGIRAIANTLELMPPGSVSPDLTARLHSLFEREIIDIVDDWRTQRSWFIKLDNPITNQWVLPTEGLIRACIVTGIDAHRQAYELGVTNLLRALDAHGAAGEFEEGIHCAEYTVTSMLHAARAMAACGDRRALDRPFLQHFPTWAAHHIQPGRFLINCFDAYGSRVPRDSSAKGAHGSFSRFWALLAVCTASPVATWALRDQFDGPPVDDVGLCSRALLAAAPADASPPPLFAAYERATRVNWRSSWSDGATGVWVRGGHATDQHDHADRGHVNFILRGSPVFIETGTAYYDHPRFGPLFRSGCGHNVLQLGTISHEAAQTDSEPGWQKRSSVAPIRVGRLDAAGGDVELDGSQCYDGLELWHRRVSWSAADLAVTDRVVLAAGKPDVVLFRWHLGVTEMPTTETRDGQIIVRCPGVTLTLAASKPIAADLVMFPDFTLTQRPWEDRSPDHLHICLIVRTLDKVQDLDLTTRAS